MKMSHQHSDLIKSVRKIRTAWQRFASQNVYCFLFCESGARETPRKVKSLPCVLMGLCVKAVWGSHLEAAQLLLGEAIAVDDFHLFDQSAFPTLCCSCKESKHEFFTSIFQSDTRGLFKRLPGKSWSWQSVSPRMRILTTFISRFAHSYRSLSILALFIFALFSSSVSSVPRHSPILSDHLLSDPNRQRGNLENSELEKKINK